MLNIRELRSAAVLAISMGLLMASACVAAAGQSKVATLLQEFTSTSRDLHKWQATQADLLKQKTAIDATAADLVKHQADLNQRMETHNTAAEQQKQLLAKSRKECNNMGAADGTNTSGHVNTCDNNIKKLNRQTAAMDAELLPLQTEQTSIDVAYSQYNQTANDWSVQEQQATTALNALYRSMNDWADQAEELISSGPFQTEVLAEHWEKSCPNRDMPGRTLSIDEVTRYANIYAKCLRYVDSQRRAIAPGA